ncbi:insulinase family protein [bacterium]|nr:insulinase family protein [bacterium]
MPRFTVVLCVLLALSIPAATATAQDLPDLEFEKYVLDNGLQVILHEDHSVPLVSVNIWYHVGSKNEKPGRTGFAHLFEHMMFQGSENHDEDYFAPLQKIGGTINGSTTEDRTNYWENVPSDQLELALWLEADRMGFLIPAMTQERLDNQKDVVQNEKRQGENQPYAVSRQLMLELLFPDDHPYHHTVIGSMDDLGAASIEDVSEFFGLYYAPNNASLCVAGDFEPAAARALIGEYFGTLPPGRPVQRFQKWIPKLDGEHRAVAQDDVELPRLYMAWHTPGVLQPGDAESDLLASVLASGKTSRLYKALVYEQQIAQDVAAYQDSRGISGIFTIQVTAKPGVSIDDLEKAVDAELRTLLDKGVRKDELARARTSYEAGFMRRMQNIGGFGGKADQLNAYNIRTGDPGYMKRDLQRYRDASARSVMDFAHAYLDLGRRAVLHVVPLGQLAASESVVDRTRMPGAGREPSFAPPAIQSADLSNGMKLYLVEKHELPLVQVNLVVKSGWAADPADKPGATALTADMLDEGTRSRDALQISDRARELGAQLGTFSGFDGSYVNLNVLKAHLDDGLDLMSDVVLNPTFPEAELERIRAEYLGRIQQESMQPVVTAYKLFQKRLFGEGHPYAQPFTGTGSAESVQKLTRDDLVRQHRELYRPNNTAVVVAGDLTLGEAVGKLERTFARWERGPVRPVAASVARPSGDGKICVVDKPGAQQSVIVIGHEGLAQNDPDVLPMQVMNLPLGGQFMSRVNMNLREDKGYTYGARTMTLNFGQSGIFLAFSQVHTEYTAESVMEFMKELDDVRGPRPISDQELADGKNQLVKSFPQQFQTIGGIAGQLGDLVLYDQPLNEWRTYVRRVTETDQAQVLDMARRHIDPGAYQIVIIGDWSEIEAGLRGLDLGEIVVMDSDAI